MSAAFDEARARLEFQLDVDARCWFGFVVGDDVRPRDRLRAWARGACEAEGRPFHDRVVGDDPLAEVAALLREKAPGLHWLRVEDGEHTFESGGRRYARLVAAFNERRDAFLRGFPGAVVVEGRLRARRGLREGAPDLFSVASFIVEAGADATEEERAALRDTTPLPRPLLARDEGDPEEMLALALETNDDAARTRALLRAGNRLIARQRHEEASAVLTRVRRRCANGSWEAAASRLGLAWIARTAGAAAHPRVGSLTEGLPPLSRTPVPEGVDHAVLEDGRVVPLPVDARVDIVNEFELDIYQDVFLLVACSMWRDVGELGDASKSKYQRDALYGIRSAIGVATSGLIEQSLSYRRNASALADLMFTEATWRYFLRLDDDPPAALEAAIDRVLPTFAGADGREPFLHSACACLTQVAALEGDVAWLNTLWARARSLVVLGRRAAYHGDAIADALEVLGRPERARVVRAEARALNRPTPAAT